MSSEWPRKTGRIPAPTRAVLLAAGEGSRLFAAQERPKPLTRVLGLTLAERAVLFFRDIGVRRLYVALGHRADEVERHFLETGRRRGVEIVPVRVKDWRDGNGASALAAMEALLADAQGEASEGPGETLSFWLAMCDHLLDPAMAEEMLRKPLPSGAVRLAVDRNLAAIFDPADATKVRLEEREGELFIRAIGKDIPQWQAVDTGLFLCTDGMMHALRRAREDGDEMSLSAAMRRLATENGALAADVSGARWLDVDTPEALAEAERRLLNAERGKAHDGPVSRWLNRPVSRWLTRRIAHLPVTPNQITIFSFLLATLAALLMALPGWWTLALGGLLAQLSSIIDGVDGEIARLKRLHSNFGAWLDAVLDRYADAFLLFGLTWHAWSAAVATGGTGAAAILWGFAAIVGSFVNSYTADKYDGFMRKRLGAAREQRFRMGRDVRVFLVMLGALLNLPLLTLALIAVVMNAEVSRRIWLLWRHAA